MGDVRGYREIHVHDLAVFPGFEAGRKGGQELADWPRPAESRMEALLLAEGKADAGELLGNC
jgi:hypothetical protein